MTRPNNTYNDHVRYAQSLYRQAKSLYDDGLYENSIDAYRHAIQIQEKTLGKYHKLTIKTYYRLGQACWWLCSISSSGDDHDDNHYVGLAMQSFKRIIVVNVVV